MRRILPTILAVSCGLVVLLDFLVPDPLLDRVGGFLLEGSLILAGFAILLGLLNILRTHTGTLFGDNGHRPSSLLLILALVGTLALSVAAPHSPALEWVFDNVYYPLQATMGALLAFFAMRAAYRAFRLQSADAAILLVSSVVMLFLQMPFCTTLWPPLGIVRDWIMSLPVAASVRGVLVGITLGIMATSLRVLVAVDRPYAGE